MALGKKPVAEGESRRPSAVVSQALEVRDCIAPRPSGVYAYQRLGSRCCLQIAAQRRRTESEERILEEGQGSEEVVRNGGPDETLPPAPAPPTQLLSPEPQVRALPQTCIERL